MAPRTGDGEMLWYLKKKSRDKKGCKKEEKEKDRLRYLLKKAKSNSRLSKSERTELKRLQEKCYYM